MIYEYDIWDIEIIDTMKYVAVDSYTQEPIWEPETISE